MNFRKDKIIKMIHKKKEAAMVVVAFFALFVFFGVTLVKIINIEVAVEDAQNYNELVKNPYEEHENIMRRTKINDLIDNKQFEEMNYDPNLIIKKDPEIKINPFKESY
ncbi:MAG: hypothetical protein KAQ87_00625 [Candidatus Pacebacteria bacterium]|nr:hypothetical protein [Candidatus Paceibacterota bacterium]